MVFTLPGTVAFFEQVGFPGWMAYLVAFAEIGGGLLLLPMGFINEMHEPTTFLGASRPETELRIIPSTWRENGAGLFGELGPFDYRTYVVNGLDASEFGGSDGAVTIYNLFQPFDETEPSMKWDGEWHITYEVFRDLGIAFAAVMVQSLDPKLSPRQRLDIYREAFIWPNGFHVNGDQLKAGFSGYTYRPFTLEGNFLAAEAVHRAYAGIALPNDASVALHERFGFRRIGVLDEIGRKFGRYWDVAWYTRPLGDA